MNVIYTILCRDIDAQLSFYQAMFGWQEATRYRSPIFRALQADNLLFGFHAPMARTLLNLEDASVGVPGDGGFPTIEMPCFEEVDATAARVGTLNGTLVKAPFVTYYGQWQAVLRDPEQNLFRTASLHLPPGIIASPITF